MLVDDHDVVRLGLAALFSDEARIVVVGEADSVATAVVVAAQARPDVILMDLRLGDGSGIEACREILATLPGVRVLFLTSYSDEEAVTATILAGAAGYLLKEVGQRALIEAVEAVAAGHSVLDPKVTQPVLARLSLEGKHDEADLSPQESRILALVVDGKTNKEIASVLKLSEKTVKNYLSNAFQKLNVRRRAQAAALYSRRRHAPR
jgi:two-component system, NarL family, response regulator DevR